MPGNGPNKFGGSVLLRNMAILATILSSPARGEFVTVDLACPQETINVFAAVEKNLAGQTRIHKFRFIFGKITEFTLLASDDVKQHSATARYSFESGLPKEHRQTAMQSLQTFGTFLSERCGKDPETKDLYHKAFRLLSASN